LAHASGDWEVRLALAFGESLLLCHNMGRRQVSQGRNVAEFILHPFIFLQYWSFELRAYNLSHSTSPFFVNGVFEIGS
jgi:hypothetical protein